MTQNLNMKHVRSFVAVAQLQSFTRAAEQLGLSQPSLTMHLRHLEDSLGVRLLERDTHSVRSTAIGRELANQFRRILQDIDAVVSTTRKENAASTGSVRIASLPSFGATILTLVASEFRARHPSVKLFVRDAVGDRITALVKSRAVEVGVTAGPNSDAELKSDILFRDRLLAVYAVGHKIDRITNITAKTLLDYPLILIDAESTVRQQVERAFIRIGLVLTPSIEVTSNATAIGMAQAGLGIAILPSTVFELRGGTFDVKVRPIAGAEFIRTISLVQRADYPMTEAAQIFVRHIYAFCSRQPAYSRLILDESEADSEPRAIL